MPQTTRTRRKRINEPRTAEEMLDILDTFFSKSRREVGRYLEGERVWNILSALRGPDEDDKHDKYITTCVIRRMALPKTAEQKTAFGSVFYGEHNTIPTRFREFNVSHFHNHIGLAAKALEVLGRIKFSDEQVGSL